MEGREGRGGGLGHLVDRTESKMGMESSNWLAGLKGIIVAMGEVDGQQGQRDVVMRERSSTEY